VETRGETPGAAARRGEMKVNVDEIMRAVEKRREFNGLDLSNIEWTNDKGEKLEVGPKVLEEWKFVGLNNVDFVELVFFGDFAEQVNKEISGS
jgi:hypothetical protein